MERSGRGFWEGGEKRRGSNKREGEGKGILGEGCREAEVGGGKSIEKEPR